MRLFVRRRTLGIQARLTMLAVVTALPLVALASFAILRMVDDQRTQIQRDVKHRVGRSARGRRPPDQRDTGGASGARRFAEPAVMATFAAFDRQMRAALKIRGTSIVLHDTKGQQLLSTNRPFGEPLPRATNTEMHDRVVATGQPQISDLIMGAVLRRPILVAGVPVFRDGQVVYVLAMGLGPEVLSSLAAGAKSFARLDGRDLRSQGHHCGAQSRVGSVSRQAGFADAFGSDARAGRELVPQCHERRHPRLFDIPALADHRMDRGDWSAEGICRRPSSPRAIGGLWRRRGSPRLEPGLGLVDGSGDPAAGRSADRRHQGFRRGASRLIQLSGGVRELDEVGNELRNAAAALARNREQLESMVSGAHSRACRSQ